MVHVKFGEYMTVNGKNHLEIEGWDTIDLAERYGTPLFVVSESTIRSTYVKCEQAFRSRYSEVLICYESKVNEGLAVKRILRAEGAGIDVASEGELLTARLTGYASDRILLSGPRKPEELLKDAIQSGITINVDNSYELETVGSIAAKVGKVARIGIRLRIPLKGYEEFTSRFLYAKTGVSTWTGYALDVCERALNMKGVKLAGFQIHTGDYTRTAFCERAVAETIDFAGELAKKHAWRPEFIDLGGGWMISRPEGFGPSGKYRSLPTIDEYAESVTSVMKEKLHQYDLGEPTLILEPGVLSVGASTVLLARVGIVKGFGGDKKWAIVDASVNQVPRVWQKDWHYHIIIANRAGDRAVETASVGGPMQSWNDYIGLDRNLPEVKRGDLLAVLDVGAYCEACDSQYGLEPRPSSVLVNRDHADLVRRRETIYDLMARDLVPSRLL
jgi:diaminopimelate decarboxylase